MKSIPRAIAAGLMATLVAGAASSQTRIDAKRDWSIFEAGDGAKKVCWIVSQPKSWTASRGGQTVQVQRGDIYLMVAVRPGDKVSNEISFIAGYPLEEGSTVKVSVGSKDFTMFTVGENAWTDSPADDDKITAAFRAGEDARVTGVSSRGTTTRDTFSLLGFTDALQTAHEHCS